MLPDGMTRRMTIFYWSIEEAFTCILYQFTNDVVTDRMIKESCLSRLKLFTAKAQPILANAFSRNMI
jgi:hypothetical protein